MHVLLHVLALDKHRHMTLSSHYYNLSEIFPVGRRNTKDPSHCGCKFCQIVWPQSMLKPIRNILKPFVTLISVARGLKEAETTCRFLEN
jgi:hypothetical protein